MFRSAIVVAALILPVVVMFWPLAACAKAASGPPPLDRVFDQARSEGEDVVYFRSHEVVRGEVLNESLEIIAPYGRVRISLRRCAAVSFAGSRTGSEAIVTVNRNRITGIVADRDIRIRIGTTGDVITVRKEKIDVVILRKQANELGFMEAVAGSDLFSMANGDLLTGRPTEQQVSMQTDRGVMNLAIGDVRRIEAQGENIITAVVTTRNGDVLRGPLSTEALTLNLDIGVSVESVYKDMFAALIVNHSATDLTAFYEGTIAPPPTRMAGGPTGAQIAGAGVAAAGAAAVIAPKPPITNSLGMKFVYIEPGEFDMGSPSDERNRDGDETRHRVKITKGFYICTTETTQEQWNELIRQNRSFWKGDKLPVSEVSWDDAVEFCRRLTDHESKEKRKYRLPTEAEWEYASRAGSTGAFPDGVSLDDLTWYFENSGERYHDVGTKRPNAWGLYDTYGNVREWCQDYYGPYPTGEVTDPKGPSTGNGRVLRGGSWDDIARYCRAAYRSEFSPGDRYNTRGFRVVLEP